MDDPDQGSDILGLPAADVIDIDTALPKTTQVYEIMRRAIACLALQPGSMVIEKLICEQLGISRTPLRGADAAAHAMKVPQFNVAPSPVEEALTLNGDTRSGTAGVVIRRVISREIASG